MATARFDVAARLYAEEHEAGFAFRAARLHAIRGLRVAHEPGSRADFAQALQLVGADPKVRRLMLGHTSYAEMPVHVSSSRHDWQMTFGKIHSIEELRGAEADKLLYRWKYFCTDGPVTCQGHLFDRPSGPPWVVVTRISRR